MTRQEREQVVMRGGGDYSKTSIARFKKQKYFCSDCGKIEEECECDYEKNN